MAGLNRSTGRPIRTTGVGVQATRPLQMGRPTRVDATLATVEVNMSGGRGKIELPAGDYVYRAIALEIESAGPIADVTILRNGRYIIPIDLANNYISRLRLFANGAAMVDMTVTEVVKFNKYLLREFVEGQFGFHFPGMDMYIEPAHRDAFALGTANLRNVHIQFEQTAAFDPATMTVRCICHHVRDTKPAGFVTTTERITKTLPSIGTHTITDLPHADDIAAIWVIADGISYMKMDVDNNTLIDCDRRDWEGWLASNGRDVVAIGDDWVVDFHADGRPRSLAALDTPEELRRSAKIKCNLTTTVQNTAVEFLIFRSGLYSEVR